MLDLDALGFLEIRLNTPDDFLKIKETLTRIGVPSFNRKTLYQSCHILHKQGKYYLVHFKELFIIDGCSADFSIDDAERRNFIVKLLIEWGLCRAGNFDPNNLSTGNAVTKTKILKFAERDDWVLTPKHSLGRNYD